jgi:hypothetical protein
VADGATVKACTRSPWGTSAGRPIITLLTSRWPWGVARATAC